MSQAPLCLGLSEAACDDTGAGRCFLPAGPPTVPASPRRSERPDPPSWGATGGASSPQAAWAMGLHSLSSGLIRTPGPAALTRRGAPQGHRSPSSLRTREIEDNRHRAGRYEQRSKTRVFQAGIMTKAQLLGKTAVICSHE